MIADHFNGKTLPKNEILPVETITKGKLGKMGGRLFRSGHRMQR